MRSVKSRNEGASNTHFGRTVMASAAPRGHSRGTGMLRTVLVVASFLVMTCAACSDGETAKPPPPSAPPNETPTSSTSPSVPPELAGYTAAERETYAEALAAYNIFIERNDAFYAAGRTTLEAKSFYQKYSIDWATAWGNLGQAANNQIRVRGKAVTVSTKPVSVELGADGADSVVLRRCLDESGRIVTQDGQKVAQPQFETPHVYRISLLKRPNEAWWRSGIAAQGQTC